MGRHLATPLCLQKSSTPADLEADLTLRNFVNNAWTFSVFAAPAMLGALLSHGVDLYADVTTNEASVAATPAPLTEYAGASPELRGVHEVALGEPSPSASDDRQWSIRDIA